MSLAGAQKITDSVPASKENSIASQEAVFVLTLSGSKLGQQVVLWNSNKPMPLGHPFQWIVEKTTTGVLIRNVSTPLQQITQGAACEISFEQIHQGLTFNLPLAQKRGFETIRIQPRQNLPAAYASRPSASGKMKVFACMGDMITQIKNLDTDFRAGSRKNPYFKLKTSAGTYQVTALSDQLRILTGDQSRVLEINQSISFTASELTRVSIAYGFRKWHFNQSQAPSFTPQLTRDTDEESRFFQKSLKTNLAGLAVVALILLFMPKSETPEVEKEEIIPAQFAKVIMKKQPAATEAPSSASGPAPAKAEKVNQTQVAKAFRSKALNNAVSKLMKGGMSRLMAQSNLVATSGQGAIFDKANSKDLKQFAIQSSDRRNVKVAELGGTGTGGDKVGYGSGDRAGLAGQGSSFVGLDTTGYDVQEGLTKDEVGKVIHAHLSEVRYCYESAMLRNPDIAGKLVVDFTIGGSGMVSTSSVQQSTLGAPRLDDCILRRLGKWKFPRPKGGVNVAVSYPFIFKSIGR